MNYIYATLFIFSFFQTCAQSGGPCVLLGNKKILTGIYTSFNFHGLKHNNATDVKISYKGKQYELGFATSIYDPNAVINFTGDIGFRYTHVNTPDTLGGTYQYGRISFKPAITYSPCFLNNIIGIRLIPLSFDYNIFNAGDNKSSHKRMNYYAGFGLHFNKEVPLGFYKHKRYFNVYNWQLFLEYIHSYRDRLFSAGATEASSPGFQAKEHLFAAGLRIMFSGYQH